MKNSHDSTMSVIVNTIKDSGRYAAILQANSTTTTTTTTTTRSSVVLASRDWDPQFHGSVHTATIAVCIVLVIFVVILGTFGNGLVLLSSLRCKLRSNFDVLIYNLAAVDFIICACLSPMFLYLLFSDPPSPKGFCAGYLFICTACGLQSLLTLVAIAAHRQSRIRGVQNSMTGRKTALILLSIYTISLASATGATLQVTLNWNPSHINCQAIINSRSLFQNNAVLFFITPIVTISFFLIAIFYIIIARAVKIQTALRAKMIQPIVKPSSTIYRNAPAGCAPLKDYNNAYQNMHQIAPESNVFQSSSKSKKTQSVRYCTCCSCAAALDKESKAVSMCYVVIIIIALCWTPLIISHFVELFTGESIILYQVKLCGIALVFLNSALDPYMYAQNNTRMKQKYAQVFWDMLRCECRVHAKPKYRTSSPGFLLPRTSPNIAMCPEEGFLPFLQPKLKSPLGHHPHNPRIDIIPNTNLNNVKITNLKCYPNCNNNKNNVQSTLYLKPGAHHSKKGQTSKTTRKGNPQNSVKTLVQKTCCNGNSPDDQSLMDSSFPRS